MSDEHVRMSAEALFKHNTLVRLNISVWTAKREMPNTDEDNRRGTYVRLVDPTYLKDINKLAGEARTFIANKGERFVLGPGTYLVTNEDLEETLEVLEELNERFLDAGEDFVDNYNDAMEDSRAVLTKEEFQLCPSKAAIPAKFGFRYGRFTIALPSDANKGEVAEWNDTLTEWAEETYTQQVVRLHHSVRHAEDILGNPKRKLFESLLGNVVRVCEDYRSKKSMVWNRPKEFTALIQRVEEVFRGMDVNALRDDDDKRMDAGVTAKALADKIEPFVPSGNDVVL